MDESAEVRNINDILRTIETSIGSLFPVVFEAKRLPTPGNLTVALSGTENEEKYLSLAAVRLKVGDELLW